MNFEEVLKVIVSKESLHGRWLNTLSYLEHLGHTKIMKSQNAESINIEILKHAHEEARHAYYLKKICLDTFGLNYTQFAEDRLLAGQESRDYLNKLDYSIEEELKDSTTSKKPYLNYLYTTLIIEQRALYVYQLYDKLLKKTHYAIPLTPLLKDESHHLMEMNNLLKGADHSFNKRLCYFKQLEEELFLNFTNSLKTSVSNFSNKVLNYEKL